MVPPPRVMSFSQRAPTSINVEQIISKDPVVVQFYQTAYLFDENNKRVGTRVGTLTVQQLHKNEEKYSYYYGITYNFDDGSVNLNANVISTSKDGLPEGTLYSATASGGTGVYREMSGTATCLVGKNGKVTINLVFYP
jgi:hypothetical protein